MCRIVVLIITFQVSECVDVFNAMIMAFPDFIETKTALDICLEGAIIHCNCYLLRVLFLFLLGQWVTVYQV